MDITEQKGSFALLLRTATLRNDRFFSIRAISLSLFLYKVNANVDMLCYICIHTVHSCINRLCWRTYNKWEEEWRSAIVNDRLSPYALAQVFFFPAVIIIRVFFLSLPYFSLCLCTNYSELLNIGRVKFTHAWASLLLSFLKLSSRMTAKKRPPSSPGREKTREFSFFFLLVSLFHIFVFFSLLSLCVCVLLFWRWAIVWYELFKRYVTFPESSKKDSQSHSLGHKPHKMTTLFASYRLIFPRQLNWKKK